MKSKIDLKQIVSKIQLMKSTAEELSRLGQNFPALARNNVRILVSLKMMEINICDLMDLYQEK
jgi:hypothetical protein